MQHIAVSQNACNALVISTHGRQALDRNIFAWELLVVALIGMDFQEFPVTSGPK